MEQIQDDSEREHPDYETIGRWIYSIRKKNKFTQQKIADEFNISRPLVSRYEAGSVKQDWDFVKSFALFFNENLDAIRKKASVAIPDTCALMQNNRLLRVLLDDYPLVIIPTTVINELINKKNNGKTQKDRNAARQILNTIKEYKIDYPNKFQVRDSDKYNFFGESAKTVNDKKIIALAREIAKDTVGDVNILTNDVDILVEYEKAIKLSAYFAQRYYADDFYPDLINLDSEFSEFEYYSRKLTEMDLDTYLPDGMTLLINCIRCRTKTKVEDIGFLPTERQKREKLKFLLDHGANIDLNDNAKYCLPPLAHCIQIDDWYTFNMLLDAGADYNKPSQDERLARYKKKNTQYCGKDELNEGNTSLMIACWSGRKKYVERLCDFPDICLNQQDSNGYTALIKCAVVRYKRKEEHKEISLNEILYKFLLDKGADPLIRDRNNHTALDWWKRADDPTYKEDEQW